MTSRGRVLVATIVLGMALAVAPRAAHAQDKPSPAEAEARERSRSAFRKGVAQLRAQDWTSARASFETAWSLFPHPSILLNLAIARLHTDDPVRAEQDLVRFLSEDGGASPDELASAREALADARSRLGSLRVIVSPPIARVAVDGTAVETVRRADAGTGGVVAEMRIKPGRHAVSVEAEGFVADRRNVDVAAKAEAAVTVTLAAVSVPVVLPPESAGVSARSIVGWSLAGLAGAALVTGGVAALRAKSLSSDYGDPHSSRYQDPDARSTGITFRTAADVALGVAIVSGAAAILLLVTDLGKDAPVTTSGTWSTHPGIVTW